MESFGGKNGISENVHFARICFCVFPSMFIDFCQRIVQQLGNGSGLNTITNELYEDRKKRKRSQERRSECVVFLLVFL